MPRNAEALPFKQEDLDDLRKRLASVEAKLAEVVVNTATTKQEVTIVSDTLCKIEEVIPMLNTLNNAVCGIHGRGGLLREVEKLNARLDEVEKCDVPSMKQDLEDLKSWRWKIIGGASALGTLGGVLASILSKLFGN